MMAFWQGNHLRSNNGRPVLTGGSLSTRSWGISSIFGSKASSRGTAATESPEETLHDAENMSSTIQLREPPSILRPLEMSENEATEIIITRILMKSYFDIVRKNIQDLVPKAIMQFLVILFRLTLLLVKFKVIILTNLKYFPPFYQFRSIIQKETFITLLYKYCTRIQTWVLMLVPDDQILPNHQR
ncbi:dynamin-related protein 3A-like [Gossypium raimondii]|uniref:dynamin-related protein 3A-like n=1 Tax=Gossypium raimondii TaxID=29730 RepID=UPI00227BD029|nr:dynamin-related protein 3A-like [Gossypium raimondii]